MDIKEKSLKKYLDTLEPDKLKKKLTTHYRNSVGTISTHVDTKETFIRRMARIDMRLMEDTEEFTFPDNTAGLLERYKVFANTLGDDSPYRHSLNVLISAAMIWLDILNDDNPSMRATKLRKEAKVSFRKCLLAMDMQYEYIFNTSNAAKALKTGQDGSTGGARAAELRAETRKKVEGIVKEEIIAWRCWNNLEQGLKSITDEIWPEIEKAIENGSDWHGIASKELIQARIGRQTIYDAVQKTDPR